MSVRARACVCVCVEVGGGGGAAKGRRLNLRSFVVVLFVEVGF